MTKSTIYEMTAADLEVLQAAAVFPNIFFNHFFKRDEDGDDSRAFNLDYNFTDDGKWQEDFCMASQTLLCVIAGVGTGKSLCVIMSAAYHSVLTPDFRFLNIAKDSNQAKVTYDLLIEQMDGTLFEKLVTSMPQRPYPQITVEYKVKTPEGKKRHIKSILSFFGLGDSGDATNVFSKRYDQVNVEEAGLIDNLSEVVTNLSTRLTGSTARGRVYMGRLSLISNAWPNPELWQIFDMAATSPDGLAINVDTRSNKSVTEKQIKASLSLTPDEDYDRFMTGKKPENTGNMFSAESIASGQNALLNEVLKKAYVEKDPEWTVKYHQHFGVHYFTSPRKQGRLYYQFGDPGTGTAPFRNAPVLMVWDVTDAPKVCSLVAFYWGNGGGEIMPFVTKMYEWIDKYQPLITGIDSTSTQKYMAEILNIQYDEKIMGLDFSGGKRDGYLNALRICLEANMFQWQTSVIGIASQLGAYDRNLDRTVASKLAQDIVAAMAMAAFVLRAHFGVIGDENGEDGAEDSEDESDGSRRASLRRRGFRR